MRLFRLILGLAVVGLLPALAQASYLYNWAGDPSHTEQTVTDPTGDVSGGNMASRDITKIWYAHDASNIYFRMDLAGAPAVNAAAGAYAIEITDGYGPSQPGGNASQSTYIAGGLVNIDQIVMSHYNAGTGSYWAYHLHNFTPPAGVDMTDLTSIGGAVDNSMNGGATLQWQIPISELGPGPYTIYGATLNIDAPATYDITGPINASALPEPSSIALLLTALLGGLAFWKRRGL